MKLTNIFFKALVMMLVILFISCSDDSSTNPNNNNTVVKLTCVVNGGEYSNKTFTFETAGGALFEVNSNETVCTFTNTNVETAAIMFTGNKTGTFTIDDEKNSFIMTLSNNTNIFGLQSGTINVTNYGSSIGSNISGTFSGTGMYVKSGSLPQTITITNGTFNCKRLN